jgi:urease accessory protein
MSMPEANSVLPGGDAPETITLDFDGRYLRRKRLATDAGREFLLHLPDAVVLHDGAVLPLSDGTRVKVRAAPEPLLAVRAASPAQLVQLAWHLGNRHLPAELHADRILIRHDHVIERMLLGLGAALARIEAPFNPEGGAYGEHNHDPGHRHAG